MGSALTLIMRAGIFAATARLKISLLSSVTGVSEKFATFTLKGRRRARPQPHRRRSSAFRSYTSTSGSMILRPLRAQIVGTIVSVRGGNTTRFEALT